MPTSTPIKRSDERRKQVAFRVSAQQHQELRERARREGVSMKTLFDRAFFNPVAQERKPGAPRKSRRHSELPLTG